MGFKSPRAMVNALVRSKCDPIDAEIRELNGRAKALCGKIRKCAENQTDEQSKAARKVMDEYFKSVDGAEKAFKLTKAQLMVKHMEIQLGIYEKH